MSPVCTLPSGHFAPTIELKVNYSVFSRDHYLAPSYDQVDFRALRPGTDSPFTKMSYMRSRMRS